MAGGKLGARESCWGALKHRDDRIPKWEVHCWGQERNGGQLGEFTRFWTRGISKSI